MEMKRAKYAVNLTKVMKEGRALIYMDESRFDNWSLQRKSWSAKGTNCHVVKNQKMYSTTCYGAISNIFPPVFLFTKGCNSENFA